MLGRFAEVPGAALRIIRDRCGLTGPARILQLQVPDVLDTEAPSRFVHPAQI